MKAGETWAQSQGPTDKNLFSGHLQTRWAHPKWDEYDRRPMKPWSVDLFLKLSTVRPLKRLTNLSTNRSKRPRGRPSRSTRFSITDPASDLNVIQTLLMPRYPAEKGANVRRWLSDSSVKYVRDSGPYEKNLIKSILNSKNLPHEDIIFQCLFETTTQTTPINIIEARDLLTKKDRFVTIKIVCKRL